jgi:hypothetical protein
MPLFDLVERSMSKGTNRICLMEGMNDFIESIFYKNKKAKTLSIVLALHSI